ncbi:MAG: glutamate--tRNA ligase [Candidatus Westeberhardia cardiocondylae]|nr:glutamate--tRNA ligase [Candidatus Westeberhardia cardiocondylae]
MKCNVKTRFSPSPSGFLHLGNIRTALYSWLFSKNQGGKFILRIDDTNLNCVKEESISDVLESLKWLGLYWDEGPYFQRKRFDRYNEVLNKMLLDGYAYKCYCSKERLNILRNFQIIHGQKPRYDGYCRNYINKNNFDKNYFVVRLCSPEQGKTVFFDLIRGFIEFNNLELDDFIIKKSDGSLTYNFCSVIDDIDMGITHIFRGEEHINNTPKQINIFKFLKAKEPKYVHLSMIFGCDKKKLSKRDNSSGIIQYREMGFLPEALLNYVVRLGWSHKNKEIFDLNEMVELFNINNINKSSSILNEGKLLWLNKYYINKLPVEIIYKYLTSYMKNKYLFTKYSYSMLTQLICVFRNRCNTLKDIVVNFDNFFNNFNNINSNLIKKFFLNKKSKELLYIFRDELYSINIWTLENISFLLRDIAKKLNLNVSDVNMPIRVAITGSDKSPNLALMIYILGKKMSISRISSVLDHIKR